MIIGFTGTQKGMTDAQIDRVRAYLILRRPFPHIETILKVHHGDCVGADAQFNNLAKEACYVTASHPASDVAEKKRAHCKVDVTHAAKPALARNHDIVDNAELLIACPGEPYQVMRSGTWATIRYAKAIARPLIIVFPDGTVEESNIGKLRV